MLSCRVRDTTWGVAICKRTIRAYVRFFFFLPPFPLPFLVSFRRIIVIIIIKGQRGRGKNRPKKKRNGKRRSRCSLVDVVSLYIIYRISLNDPFPSREGGKARRRVEPIDTKWHGRGIHRFLSFEWRVDGSLFSPPPKRVALVNRENSTDLNWEHGERRQKRWRFVSRREISIFLIEGGGKGADRPGSRFFHVHEH